MFELKAPPSEMIWMIVGYMSTYCIQVVEIVNLHTKVFCRYFVER